MTDGASAEFDPTRPQVYSPNCWPHVFDVFIPDGEAKRKFAAWLSSDDCFAAFKEWQHRNERSTASMSELEGMPVSVIYGLTCQLHGQCERDSAAHIWRCRGCGRQVTDEEVFELIRGATTNTKH